MRFTGKLTTWHGDRGFGFITPDEGGQDIFVHASALPHGIKPQVGQAYGFEVALNAQGKKKAVGVFVNAGLVPARTLRPARAHRMSRATTGDSSLLKGAVVVAIIAAMAWAGYRHYSGLRLESLRAPVVAVPVPERQSYTGWTAPSPSPYSCGGRTMCSQMSSCQEATWVLKNCPGTKMDGNGDGVPCEKQFCK